MTAALHYLMSRSLGNSLRVRASRLRQPKYLLGALFGAAYFYFYFYKIIGGGGAAGQPMAPGVPDALWLGFGAVLLLLAVLLFAWIFPDSRAALRFTEAEIAFLFPAPITRRRLIIYKLLKSQMALLMFAVLMTLVTGRFRLGNEAWFRMGAWWVILNTLNMHRIGASFALQRLRERGMADWKRRAAVLVALGGLAAFVEYTRRALPPLPAGVPGWEYAAQLLEAGPVPYALAPFKAVVRPYFAHDAMAFLAALGPAVALMLLHFLWVVRSDGRFEEAAISAAQRRAAILASAQKGEVKFSLRSGKARVPLWRLGVRGFEPVAFLWKFLLKFGGRRTMLFWVLFFLILAAAVTVVRVYAGPKPSQGVIIAATVIGAGCYITGLVSLVMVGQQAGAQLRQGMAAMDLLKTYPLPGWKIALGELLGPVTLGTLMQWCALGVGAYLGLGFMRTPGAALGFAVVFGGLAVVLPAFNLAMSILPCAIALAFPGWFKPQDAATPGVENMGLRLLMGVGQLLAMAVALLPVVFFGACAWFAVGPWLGGFVWKMAVTGAVAAFVLALEAALGVAWLGRLYDDYDGSAE